MNEFEKLGELALSFPQLARDAGESACYAALDASLRRISARRHAFTPDQETQEMARFRQIILPLTRESDFCRHAYDKPRGYPGDFVSQEMIWLGRSIGREHRYAGTSDVGRILNALTFDMSNCRANEARVYRLREAIQSSGRRLMSIGCGSCIELWDSTHLLTPDSDVFLVDQDQGALDRAKTQIPASPGSTITFHRDNVLKFALRAREPLIKSRDFVYVFGLLDYFPQSSAHRIAHGLWEYVAPGGTLLLTNAHPANPTKLWMEWVGDWFLDYKPEQDFRALATGLDGVEEVIYSIDQHGVYQYLQIRAKA